MDGRNWAGGGRTGELGREAISGCSIRPHPSPHGGHDPKSGHLVSSVLRLVNSRCRFEEPHGDECALARGGAP